MPVRPAQQVIARQLVDALIGVGGGDGEDDDSFSLLSWSTFSPNSTAIQRVQHRLRNGDMTVRFQNKPGYPDYLYGNVPRELFKQWKRVQSPGKFYHRRIKNQFFHGGGSIL